MESESIRSFRDVEFEPGVIIQIRSASTGKPVEITHKKLNNYEKGILSSVCDFIEGKLKGTSFEESIKTLMKKTGFCATSSKQVVAYSGLRKDEPLVILNSKIITGSTDEFAVTVLHELLHFVNVLENHDPNSLEEAKGDLACYDLLGVPVPINHWAFTKFPHLKDKLIDKS
jgi:hypothetical protein